MHTVLVTGATSFIGRHLINVLLHDNYVFGIIRPNSLRRNMLLQNPRLSIIETSMDAYDMLPDIIGKIHHVDTFIHLAWNGTRGNLRNDKKLQEHNLSCSLNALQSAVALGVSTFVSAGSQAEYGPWQAETKLVETVTPHPNTEYGKAKLAFYESALHKCNEKGIRFIEPRFFSLYGPGDFAGTMVISMLKNMLQNKECNLTESVQTWDFLYIDDAVKGLLNLIQDPSASGIYNFGSGDSHPLKWFIEKMYELTKSSSKLNFGAIPYPPTGMVNVNPDVSRLMATGWKPGVSFEEGISAIIKIILADV